MRIEFKFLSFIKTLHIDYWTENVHDERLRHMFMNHTAQPTNTYCLHMFRKRVQHVLSAARNGLEEF